MCDDKDNMNDSLRSEMRIISSTINIKWRDMQIDVVGFYDKPK